MNDYDVRALRPGDPVYTSDGQRYYFYCMYMNPFYNVIRVITDPSQGSLYDFAISDLFLTPPGIQEGKKEKNMTTIREKFALSLTPEPQKSFRKAEITNGDNILTDEGARIFLTYLLGKNAEAFKKDVVDDLLKEDKK